MNIIDTALAGVKLIEPSVHGDQRGFFMESYNERDFHEQGLLNRFIQDNHSLSAEVGVLRGLHYQLNPKAQTKLVRVTAGEIYDVVVDLRRGSSTFGRWQGFHLSVSNKLQLLVPQGFAHGFCTLTPNTEVQYKVDEYYSPEHDRGIAWNDPALAIDWPTSTPILSDKDSKHPLLADAENNFVYEG
ncbi:dTDP-4-dehydrorhamnose 3,5-epimerase [Paenibacillus radicis (ex Gao et al. 2016)]|uniref:dTDP-4-dehydrorhamnose 3,5-epimerase n=1 Tax=Paenibacillus radicis (ex Gao et al. 2016) TaxID=1737354 RepID=A0A917H0A9_9BACL|nr:dTDP-4-dehydrorhamnose 3,5-epimerase [Paenibacillus radicis (ex Gao et al. 2016)]GGG63358.1 dTDP-4-dehydrorhamnose 3,5-epimerase [Paenibacillus radicis (ex Gao et al. 2016)]